MDKGQFNFQEKFEDIHLNIEKKLFEIIGPSAGFLHTARSRNDQVVTVFKLWIKKSSKEILKEIDLVMKNLIKKAEKNTDTVMPGLTHLKNAQPISFAHYLLSYYEMLKRDQKRFENNIKLMDECPLGSSALSGTSHKIDRSYTAKKLGFKKPTDNSIDSVSDRDFAIDFLYASAVCAMHLSRLAEDFIIYNSDAFALISFNDNMLTGSSIMPQKKNPDPAELIRGRVGVSYGKLNSLLTIMKGLPMSYFKDLQDDKELVFDGYDTLKDTLTMSAELINSVKPIKTNMLEMANKGYTTATDFADYLVKEKHLSFRESYAISAKLVNFAEKNKKTLSELSLKEVKKIYKDLDKRVLKVFDVKNSMNIKKSYGGTSETNVKTMIKKYKKEIK
jgi:argininosuccinate lyase